MPSAVQTRHMYSKLFTHLKKLINDNVKVNITYDLYSKKKTTYAKQNVENI
jgi:hypothetical protein